MERGIMFAHRSIVEHEVLQRVMQTEPDTLLPALTVESNRIREGIAEFLVPYVVERGVAAGCGPRRRGRLPGPDGPLLHLGPRAAGTSRIPTRSPGWSGPNSSPGWWPVPGADGPAAAGGVEADPSPDPDPVGMVDSETKS